MCLGIGLLGPIVSDFAEFFLTFTNIGLLPRLSMFFFSLSFSSKTWVSLDDSLCH